MNAHTISTTELRAILTVIGFDDIPINASADYMRGHIFAIKRVIRALDDREKQMLDALSESMIGTNARLPTTEPSQTYGPDTELFHAARDYVLRSLDNVSSATEAKVMVDIENFFYDLRSRVPLYK